MINRRIAAWEVITMQNLAFARGWIPRALIAASLALGGGLGTFAIAHAATSPSASPAAGYQPDTVE